MSKEQGILNKGNAERILGEEKIKAKLLVKGADGKVKTSSLAEGVSRMATPEQVKKAQNGGLAADVMLMKHMDDLALNGPARDARDTLKAREITMKAEKEVVARERALSMAKGGAER